MMNYKVLCKKIEEYEGKIEELLESMEFVSSLITKTENDIMKVKGELKFCEAQIRLNTDFDSVGCNNREEREMYIMSMPEYRELYLYNRDLQIDLSEYRHRYNVDSRELDKCYRIYDRLVGLEKRHCEYDLND